MDFSLKLIVSLVIAIAAILLLATLLQSNVGGFPQYAKNLVPLS